MITLTIPGPPIPWKAPYVGCRGAFSPRTKIMNDFRAILKSQYKENLISTAIRCDLVFFMPIPKSVSKKKRELMINGNLRPITTPDRGNLLKLFEDCLQDSVICNDSLIVEGNASKWYSEMPRTLITITVL